MSDDLLARIESALAAKKALNTREIAATVGCQQDDAERVIWGSPDRFTWQPGGRWTLAAAKSSTRAPTVEPEHHDTRDAVLDPPGAVELRAIMLEGGGVLRVIRRPLDSSAFFTVKQVGSDLQLVLNSAHEVFADLPMPFDDEPNAGDYKRLVELLLAAWAIHEGDMPAGPSKRSLEDTRLMWGRSLSKVFPDRS